MLQGIDLSDIVWYNLQMKKRLFKPLVMSLGFLIILYAVIAFSYYIGVTNAKNSVVVSSVGVTEPLKYKSVFNLVNNERAKNKLPALVEDQRLDESAQAKCNDMVQKRYWDHDSPDGATPWDFIKKTYPDFKTAGENLGGSFSNDENLVAGWMNSEGHRKNILNKEFTKVGYGKCYAEDYLRGLPGLPGKSWVVVQHFVSD